QPGLATSDGFPKLLLVDGGLPRRAHPVPRAILRRLPDAELARVCFTRLLDGVQEDLLPGARDDVPELVACPRCVSIIGGGHEQRFGFVGAGAAAPTYEAVEIRPRVLDPGEVVALPLVAALL